MDYRDVPADKADAMIQNGSLRPSGLASTEEIRQRAAIPDDKLEQIFEHQRDLQIKAYGHDPVLMTQLRKIAFILEMSYALEDEVHEATGEVGWKSWATSKHINREAYVSELIDALHFLVNLFLVVGATPTEVTEKYHSKAKRNAQRQAEGYDGVKGKCRICRRDFKDAGVSCTEGHCRAAKDASDS